MLTVEPFRNGLPSWEMANVVPLLDNWRSRTAAEIVAVRVKSRTGTSRVENIFVSQGRGGLGVAWRGVLACSFSICGEEIFTSAVTNFKLIIDNTYQVSIYKVDKIAES